MIQHVTRLIPRQALPELVAFYRLLGFVPVVVPQGIAGRAEWLALGQTQLHLMFDEAAQPESGHIAVVASDYDGTVARLSAAGHAVEPRSPHWGAARGYVRDPFGNLVELMAFPPESSDRSDTI